MRSSGYYYKSLETSFMQFTELVASRAGMTEKTEDGFNQRRANTGTGRG